MATRYWQDVSSDFESTSNWSAATVPVTGDSFHVLSGSTGILTTLDQSDQDFANITFGPEFVGPIGTATSPLKLGTLTGTITINSPLADTINLWPVGVGTVVVAACNNKTYACHFYDGAITSLYVTGGQQIRIGAGMVITTLHVIPNSLDTRVFIEQGAAVTTINQSNGTIYSSAGCTTYNGRGGLFRLQGDQTASVTTINLNSEGNRFVVENEGTSTTFATVNAFKGVFQLDTATAKTITNGNCYLGGYIDLRRGKDTVTVSNALSVYGGQVWGTDNVSTIAGVPDKISGNGLL